MENGSTIRRFTCNSIIVFSSSISSSVTGFFLVAFAARRLGANGFGLFSTVQIIVTSMAVLTDIGLATAVVREVAQQRHRTPEIAGNIIALKTLLGLITLPLTWLLVHFLGYDYETQRLALIYGAMLIPQSIGTACTIIFNGHEKMKYSSIVWLTNAIAYAAGAVAIWMNGKLELLFVILTAGACAGAVISIVVLVIRFEVKHLAIFDLKLWGRYLRCAYPYGIMSVIGMVGVSVGPIMLRSTAGEAQLGYFNCANKLASVLMIIVSAYSLAAFPVFSRLQTASEAALHHACRLSLKILLIFGLPGAAALTIAAPLITLLFPKYDQAVPAFQLLVWYVFFAGLATPLLNLLYAESRQGVCSIFAAIAAFIAIGIDIAFIPTFGIAAACAASILFTSIQFVLAYILVGSKWPLNLFEAGAHSVILGLGLALSAVISLMLRWPPYALLPAGILCALPLAMKILDAEERKLLGEMLRCAAVKSRLKSYKYCISNPHKRDIERILRQRIDYSKYLAPDLVRDCDHLFEERWATNRAAFNPLFWNSHFEIENAIRSGVLNKGRILDFGCGTGNIDIELARRGFNITAIDLSPKAIDIANLFRSDLPEDVRGRLEFSQADINTFKPETKFAACMALHVMEHIEDPGFLFDALRDLLVDDGVLWISVPFGGAFNDPRHVHHFYSENELRRFLEQYAPIDDVVHDPTNNVLSATLRIRSKASTRSQP